MALRMRFIERVPSEQLQDCESSPVLTWCPLSRRRSFPSQTPSVAGRILWWLYGGVAGENWHKGDLGMETERDTGAQLCAALGVGALVAGSVVCAQAGPAILGDLALLRLQKAILDAEAGLLFCALAVACATAALFLGRARHGSRVYMQPLDRRWQQSFSTIRWVPLHLSLARPAPADSPRTEPARMSEVAPPSPAEPREVRAAPRGPQPVVRRKISRARSLAG